MKYRQLGESDLKLSVITFGAWAVGGWMWGGTDRQKAVEAIRASYDAGATTIDTAPIYGMGLSEELVAEAISDIPRDQVQIVTKYGMRWSGTQGDLVGHSDDANGKPVTIYKLASRDSIIEECEDSLRRLKTDYIDLYQIHWHDSTTPISVSMEAVARLIEQGKVRYAGVCNYDVEQMTEASKHVHIISNQVPYSMVQRDIEADVVPYCMKNKLGILAYSPLQRGLLTGKLKPGHVFADGDHRDGNRYFTDESIEATNTFLHSIQHIAENHNATFAQIVLAWTLEQPGITIALAGARNADQALQNAAAGDLELSADELAEISKKLDDSRL